MNDEPGTYHGETVRVAARVLRELSDRAIAFQPTYARLAGSITAGLFLSQAMYWTGTLPPSREGWFYKTQPEWEAETCLSRSEQESARKRLVTLGLLQEERRGTPARLWYRVNTARLALLLAKRNAERSAAAEAEDLQSSLQESRNLDRGIPAIKNAGYPQTITETTPDTTAEKKRANARAASPSTSKKPAVRNDPRLWAAVASFWKAKGISKADIPDRQSLSTYDAMKDLPAWVQPEDVLGCTAYMLQIDAFKEPGKLTARRVVETLAEWRQKGRPEAPAPRNGNGAGGRLTPQDILRQGRALKEGTR